MLNNKIDIYHNNINTYCVIIKKNHFLSSEGNTGGHVSKHKKTSWDVYSKEKENICGGSILLTRY